MNHSNIQHFQRAGNMNLKMHIRNIQNGIFFSVYRISNRFAALGNVDDDVDIVTC
jgi:hypothetical protein